MTTKVTMPQMGESIFEGTITKWLKKVGENVAVDEPLFEISTDKVDSEIPSPAAGILGKILVPEGRTVQINTVLAIIDGAGTEEKDEVFSSGLDVASQETPEQMPAAGPEPPPPAPEPQKEAAPPAARVPKPPPPAGPRVHVQDIRTSPLVRKLARENNVDLSEIKGTGLEGRITKDDVLNYLSQRPTPEKAVPKPPRPLQAERPPEPGISVPPAPPSVPEERRPAAPAVPGLPRFAGESDVVPMTPIRKAIAAHMVYSKRTSAHVNTVFEIDVSPIVRLRGRHKAEFEKREGIPLTYTPFFAKALVDNVREFPVFNSSVSEENIVYKKPINLGVAVALETGLIVPVIKDAHLRSFTGLALAIYDLADRARTKRLKPEEVQNGTISMTNPGSFGALFATPIINQPQVAILGVGGIAKRPVVVDDAIAVRSMVYLSLTFDHRVIDGLVADQFMAKLKTRLQSWTQWVD